MHKDYKQLSEYPKYAVSGSGSIINIATGRILSTHLSNEGYQLLTLRRGGKAYSLTVHRLVAKTYLKNPNQLPCVNHIDGDKTNNDVSNLEWCTYQENIKHRFKNKEKCTPSGRRRGFTFTGEKSKLSKDDIKRIISCKGIVTQRQLAEEYDVSRATISLVHMNRFISNFKY